MADHDIGVLVGSLRRASYSRRVAEALIALAPAHLHFTMVDLAPLPMYNQDLDDDKTPPAEWTAFREQVRPFDAVLFVTPEYNRSVPALLKNALDIGSRPYGASVWSGKPAAVVSVTPGAMGGFGANHALRQSLVFLDMPAMQQPEAYIGNAAKLFADDGSVVESSRAFFTSIVDKFATWIDKTA
ncbi:NADPH-dependent FMN reductase [Glacieibacterium sp.]|uniref:NADPH-dependent FMN reductase n=1 Tax=Glacieibacterium sp. TaxID=2860237 RepID=UPI003B00D150